MTGIFATLAGEGSVVAAQMAVEDFGGEVLGRKIRVLAGDHKHKAEVASAITTHWFNDEHADHGDDFGPVEAGIQAGLVEAPVPVVRRCGEEQHQEVAPGEDTADLAPPVHARRDVDAGHEAFDEPRAEALYRPLHFDREHVIVVLVADEHRELVVRDRHCFVPPSRVSVSAPIVAPVQYPRPLIARIRRS